MTLGTPTTALVEPAGATRPLGVFIRGARALLLGGALASCAGSGTRNAADATAPVDLGVVNDLSPPPDQGPADASADDALDVLDASIDLPGELGADASVDRRDASSPWGDAPLVDLGGILIPVDPNAVPAPGSECTGDAGVRAGDPTIAPPRPVRPLSVSRVTSQRPTFQWVLPAGTTGARVEVCADRCCSRVLQTIDAEGTTVRPMTALPPGVVFWRMFGRRGTVVGSRASYTWEFGVRRRDAPNDTSWGTIRDFNGDGFDDLIVFRPQVAGSRPSDLIVIPGAMGGPGAPVMSGVVAGRTSYRAMVGDFNGDGLADIAWDDRTQSGPLRSWFEVVEGSRGRMRSSIQPDVSALGECAVTGDGAVVDWNGDGYSDLLIGVGFGCDFSVPPTASILLGFAGSHSGITAVPQWAWRADGRFNHSLVSISGGVGDVDNDGYGDIFVASVFSGVGTSSVPAEQVIVHGVAAGEPLFERVPQPMPPVGDWGSGRATSVGDVDGDGHIDVLVSLRQSNPVYLYRYATGFSQPSASLMDPVGGSNFGHYFSFGDVSGDGLSDAIISSELAFAMSQGGLPISQGIVYVFVGSMSGTVAEPVRLERSRPHLEEVPREIFGGQPRSPGDLDGDGIDDITMGDSISDRLCVRFGRVGFGAGSPDICQDGVLTWGAQSY